MKKILIGSLLLVAAAQAGACGGDSDDGKSSAYCCINQRYYSCTEAGSKTCFDTRGADTSGCSRDTARDSSCK